jgi:hypothetical protein
MDVKGALVDGGKYLVHGLGFAFLAYTVDLIWTRLFAALPAGDAWLGLILVLVVFGIGCGFLNSLMMHALWLRVERGWKTHFGQALILFPIFFAIEVLPLYFLIPAMAAFSYVNYLASFLIVNILYAFADGYIAKRVGFRWKARGLPRAAEKEIPVTPEPEIQPDNPQGVHCPRCGGTDLIVAKDHSAYCIDCKRGLRKEMFSSSA